MVTVEICIGSACYVHGSNQLIPLLQTLIHQEHWQDRVTLKGAFCMQACTRGIGVRINGRMIEGVGLHNAKSVLFSEIKKELETVD